MPRHRTDEQSAAAPAADSTEITGYTTPAGIEVTRSAAPFDPRLLAALTRDVDTRRGGVLSSGMEYPGRYSRWHVGYVDPCLEISARGRLVTIRALNRRGDVLLPAVGAAARRAAAGGPAAPAGSAAVPPEQGPAGDGPHGSGPDESGPGESGPDGSAAADGTGQVQVLIPDPGGSVPEEERSRRPTVFSALREIIAALSGPDPHLGLYGAFGYDLAFQFEPVRQRHRRDDGQRDLVLHLPDRLYVLDRKRETAICYAYEFRTAAGSTAGLPRRTAARPRAGAGPALREATDDLPAGPEPGSYARVVEQARERFARGDLFEVVPSHCFYARCGSPAAFYERLRRRNPAPYEFFWNLGEGEYLVGASPEMYVRVSGGRVETCPIAGTVARGGDPLEDAANIRELLSSAKAESELTMCTDVDRNDKSRICEPGSIAVIGRRQVELYSRVIHTVDHIEGRLRPGFDALDAFLSHMWAVTVTGAPKTWAMQFIEDHENAPRRWYGGAVGVLGFDGSINTGLTLRTAHIRGSVAAVRAGATLLYDSDPADEEQETHIKARALLETLTEPDDDGAAQAEGQQAERGGARAPRPASPVPLPGDGLRVLLVDHQDSFVHTLAGYFRELGAAVTTLRAGFDPALLDRYGPDLVVLSPGPGRPADFGCARLLAELDRRQLSAFGVCLGLQAMVEHAGGTLGVLDPPVHGKTGLVRRLGQAEPSLLAGLPDEFSAARYHSLHARPAEVRGGFAVTAVTPDGVVMAIEDPAARRWAVQFHPESILTASGRAGYQVIANVLALCQHRAAVGQAR